MSFQYFLLFLVLYAGSFFWKRRQRLGELLFERSVYEFVYEGRFIRRILLMLANFFALVMSKPSSGAVRRFFLENMSPEFRGRFFGKGMKSLVFPEKPLSVREADQRIVQFTRLKKIRAPVVVNSNQVLAEWTAEFPQLGVLTAVAATVLSVVETSTEKRETEIIVIEENPKIHFRSVLTAPPLFLNKITKSY